MSKVWSSISFVILNIWFPFFPKVVFVRFWDFVFYFDVYFFFGFSWQFYFVRVENACSLRQLPVPGCLFERLGGPRFVLLVLLLLGGSRSWGKYPSGGLYDHLSTFFYCVNSSYSAIQFETLVCGLCCYDGSWPLSGRGFLDLERFSHQCFSQSSQAELTWLLLLLLSVQ